MQIATAGWRRPLNGRIVRQTQRDAMSRYFGLDLSGYSTGRSGLAELRPVGDHFQALVYRDHPFARTAEGYTLLEEVCTPEREALSRMTELGTLLVDVPLDVAALLTPEAPTFVWQLTARPVDFAFGALRPLADRIGAAVARFRNVMRTSMVPNLKETYPAACLAAAGLPSTLYKGQTITWDRDRWVGGMLADVASRMRIVASAPLELTDDDVDAIICAYAGAAPLESVLAAESLRQAVHTRLRARVRAKEAHLIEQLTVPANFQLFRTAPLRDIHVELCAWANFSDEAA